jgi:putative membrane protein insertion efficiency factor
MKKIILGLIRIYQKSRPVLLAPFHALLMTDSICRFTPTCSEYTYQAVKKYGSIKGTWLGLKRFLRCNPWNKGGHDPLK